ncbi:bacterio-opsin activator [Halorubrum sp. BOL3-1]|uniref:helix-turn-helix domain-containing protein n=1 Tax=Halorubrum sp. BOL3-1 TaxID=2497325 RepID=UPI0010050932|nr:helix-turn-helix domain-containing protein [Halorubrum sp. BOL3-1]QAU14257.1 bacterio-opsin activator [Halorubrum sp. BOL3-1]
MTARDDAPEAGETDDGATRRLYVEFEVEPSPSTGCPLSGFERDVAEVRQQRTGDRCHTDLTLSSDDCGCADDDCTEVVHAASAVEDRCPCAVFSEHGCVPRITGTDGDDVVIETYLPDRDVLTDLVDDLRAVVDGISLRRLKRIGSLEREESRAGVTLDLFELTEKQREAAATAVAAGYYSRPREADLEELSADLGISKSALSQRLTAVESKLATSAFARVTAD